MVPLCVLLGGLALIRLVTTLSGGGHGGTAALTSLLTGAFYALIVKAYLRRGAAASTSRDRLVLVAAPVATFLPFAMPFTGVGGTKGLILVAGDLLLLSGFAFSLWSLRCLDRSLSVIPQARTLVQHGPYARVRHPLYLGELVAMLGLALTLGGPVPLLLWATLIGLQAYRAVHEERLLRAVLPDYAAYAAHTARIVPGVF